MRHQHLAGTVSLELHRLDSRVRDPQRNLRQYRQARGMSQEAFADLVGVHRTYMGGMERGERNLTLRSVERIAEAIGLEPLELMRG